MDQQRYIELSFQGVPVAVLPVKEHEKLSKELGGGYIFKIAEHPEFAGHTESDVAVSAKVGAKKEEIVR